MLHPKDGLPFFRLDKHLSQACTSWESNPQPPKLSEYNILRPNVVGVAYINQDIGLFSIFFWLREVFINNIPGIHKSFKIYDNHSLITPTHLINTVS